MIVFNTSNALNNCNSSFQQAYKRLFLLDDFQTARIMSSNMQQVVLCYMGHKLREIILDMNIEQKKSGIYADDLRWIINF